MSNPSTPDVRFQCRHIFPSGHRCGSPALRQEIFCFFHHTTRKPIPKEELAAREDRQEAAEGKKSRRIAFSLPRADERSSIQSAIAEVLIRLASNALDPRRAGLLLYGLQIASLNLPKQKEPDNPAETVEDMIEDPELGPLALPQDFDHRPNREKNLEEILMEQWDMEASAEVLPTL